MKTEEIKANVYKCPKCGMETAYDFIDVKFEEIKGKYCLWCWGQWLVKNIPKMKKKKEK